MERTMERVEASFSMLEVSHPKEWSLIVSRFLLFIHHFAVAVTFPSLFFFLSIGEENMLWLGPCFAAVYVGELIATPIFSNLYRRRPTTEILVSGSMLTMMGCLIFGISNNGLLIFSSRLLIGLGGGINLPLKYVAYDCTAPSSQIHIQGKLMTLPIAAFALGTGLSFCLIMAPDSFGGTLHSALRWTGFAPGLLSFIGLGGVAYLFTDPPEKSSLAVLSPSELRRSESTSTPPLLTCMGINMCLTVCLCTLQTVTAAYASSTISWTIETTAIFFAFLPTAGILALSGLDISRRWIGDRNLMFVTFGFTLLGYALVLLPVFSSDITFAWGQCLTVVGIATGQILLLHFYFSGVDKVAPSVEQMPWLTSFYLYSELLPKSVTPLYACVLATYPAYAQIPFVIASLVALAGLCLFFVFRRDIIGPGVGGEVLPAADPMEIAGYRILGDRDAFNPLSANYMKGFTTTSTAGTALSYKTFAK